MARSRNSIAKVAFFSLLAFLVVGLGAPLILYPEEMELMQFHGHPDTVQRRCSDGKDTRSARAGNRR